MGCSLHFAYMRATFSSAQLILVAGYQTGRPARRRGSRSQATCCRTYRMMQYYTWPFQYPPIYREKRPLRTSPRKFFQKYPPQMSRH